jgi:hypothetical protein
LASILFAEIRHPIIFPFVTPNTHFSGFNFNPTLLVLAKVSAKSLTWPALSPLDLAYERLDSKFPQQWR